MYFKTQFLQPAQLRLFAVCLGCWIVLCITALLYDDSKWALIASAMCGMCVVYMVLHPVIYLYSKWRAQPNDAVLHALLYQEVQRRYDSVDAKPVSLSRDDRRIKICRYRSYSAFIFSYAYVVMVQRTLEGWDLANFRSSDQSEVQVFTISRLSVNVDRALYYRALQDEGAFNINSMTPKRRRDGNDQLIAHYNDELTHVDTNMLEWLTNIVRTANG